MTNNCTVEVEIVGFYFVGSGAKNDFFGLVEFYSFHILEIV